jgi:predicted dithiol-disulfide oxidoreductase (DUF899 family)
MKEVVNNHKVISEAEWLQEREKLLIEEKEFTRRQEELNLKRRSLPWVKVAKKYTFDGSKGTQTLADLFEGRSQLIIYHFMFGPDDKAGCQWTEEDRWQDTMDTLSHVNAPSEEGSRHYRSA